MRDRLGRDLTAAMKSHDGVSVAALRSACAAIDNAGAVTVVEQRPAHTSEHVAGVTAGPGATEATRRTLSSAEVEALLQGQVDERMSAADSYDGLGRGDHADRLRAEADVLRRYVRPAG